MSNPNNVGNQGSQDSQSPWPVYGQNTSGNTGGLPGSNPWPVYGSPGSAGSAGAGGSAGGGSGSYGQSSGDTSGSAPGTTYGPTSSGPYGQPAPSHYQQPPAGAGQSQVPPAGGPFATPQQGSGMYRAQTAPGAPMMPGQNLPGRAGPILTIVLGAVMMVIVAPIVLISMLLGGMGMTNIVEQSLQAQNGGTVTVDETGVIGVAASSNATISCSLEGSSETIQMTPEVDGAVLVARGLTPGQYTLNCEGLSSADALVIFDGGALENILPATMKALGWSSVVGIGGFVALIWGIVWLVKRNRQRRAMMPNYPMYGSGYGGPYGPGGPQGA